MRHARARRGLSAEGIRRSRRALIVFSVIAVVASLFAVPQRASAAAETAVHLDGSSGYVTFGDPAKLDLAQFTVETWFMRTGTGVAGTTGGGGIPNFVPLVTHGAPQAENSNVDADWLLGIDDATDTLAADFEEGSTGSTPGLNHPVYGTTTITDDVWHHAAATYDGATWNLYLDGNLETTLFVGQPTRSDTVQHAALGAMIKSDGTLPAGRFDGSLDEARVWNFARGQSDIQATMGDELASDPGAPGGSLVARWGLDEGAGTIAGDSIAPAATGTLTGGTSWVSGFNYTEPVPNPGPYSVVFNGTDTAIQVPDSASLDAANFTVEAWVKRAGVGTTTSTGTGGLTATPVITKGRAEAETAAADVNYFLGIDAAGRIAVDFEQSAPTQGPNHPFTGTSVVPLDEWHHVAATYDGADWNVYLDGQPDGTLAVNAAANAANNAPVGIGRAYTTTNVASGAFAGSIDEARVWNVARTPGQIAGSFDDEIDTPTPGLQARWGMNEDSGAAVPDSINGNAGALVNGTRGAGFVAPVPNNSAPDAPVVVAPADTATGVSTTPTLDVTVTDPDGGLLDVSFYGRPLASGDFSLIDTATGITSGDHATVTWPSIGDGQTFEWYASVSDGSLSTAGAPSTFHTSVGSDTVFVAVGDMGSCATTGDEQVAALIEGLDGTIVTSGDNVYPNGTATDFANCLDPAWGQFTSRMRPAPGNHDWGTGTTNNLDGYFGYFGANATDSGGNSYYSYDLDSSWHVVTLDSECDQLPGGCAAGSPQEQWLAADLAANSTKNTIAVFHKPRFGSGQTNFTPIQPLMDDLYAAGVDITLAGHDHIYERLAPIGVDGLADPAYGMRHFTVGTGGEGHHGAQTPIAASEALNDQTFGVGEVPSARRRLRLGVPAHRRPDVHRLRF